MGVSIKIVNLCVLDHILINMFYMNIKKSHVSYSALEESITLGYQSVSDISITRSNMYHSLEESVPIVSCVIPCQN